jgi:glucokinase
MVQASEIYDSAANYAGRAFSYAVNIIDPGCIFVGGGVGLSYDLLESGVRGVMQSMYLSESNRDIPIVATKLGYDAALLGAASLIWGIDK